MDVKTDETTKSFHSTARVTEELDSDESQDSHIVIKDPVSENQKQQILRKWKEKPSAAQIEIGDLYMSYVRAGQEELITNAMEYYEKAILEESDKYAYVRLAAIYHYGRYGVKQDYQFAQELYLEAHNLGHSKAWDLYYRALCDETYALCFPVFS
jgi:TPR repeat protein